VSTIDGFVAEARKLAKIVQKAPDLRCFDQIGRAAYLRRVKFQKWHKAVMRLALLTEVIDDYIRHQGHDGYPALPKRWKKRRVSS
jgi:hypothetical protein